LSYYGLTTVLLPIVTLKIIYAVAISIIDGILLIVISDFSVRKEDINT